MIQINYIVVTIILCLLLLGGVAVVIYIRKLSSKNAALQRLLEANKELIRKAENELIEANNRIEQSDKLKSSFLANMSHEIRTPLNAIMGFSSLLMQSSNLDKDSKEYLEIINNNSTRLLDLMDEIFNIALIESGIISMYKEDCNVNELLVSLVAFFNIEKEINGKSEVTIRARKANKDGTFTINTDPRKFRQTLYNLVENALKYTEKGYIEVGYELKSDAMVEFYVKDTGIGFPQGKLDTLFEQFRQGDESSTRHYGGIGLGLSLSKKFVEMMGGVMIAKSIPGEGSTFYFTLPCNSSKEIAK
jgi:signal transduction histidine kinase